MKKLFVFLVFFLILILLGSLTFNLWSGKRNLEETKTALLAGDFEKAKIMALRSSRSFQRAKICGRISQIGDLIEFGETLADAALHLAKTGESLEEIVSLVLGGKAGNLEKVSQEAKLELDLAWEDLSLIEGELKKRPIVEMPKLREKIEMVRGFLSVLPEILPEEKRSYLFLLQNNMELRPTGGFIGSYALVIFEKGRLLDFQVEDVYTADGQLKGHVEPPEPIKKYLGEAGWYLRDSNFDPDFPKTAQKVKWFFQKETGRVVDGVIGINLFVAQKILEAIGPVELFDYQETITASNLFERAEYHSEIGFFPGSTQKRDFLAALTVQLFQKMTQVETGNWLKIGQAIFASLEENQILISLDDEKAMRMISGYNWDGRVRPSMADYLMIVESNFGVNKVNYFLKRSLHHEVELGEETEEALTIHYQNNSPSQTWPGGVYKNYLRIYTPLGSQLLEGSSQVEVSSASGKTVFGFLVEVPVGEEKEVSIRYKIPFNLENLSSYSLLFQKQSGTGGDPLTVLISYPSSIRVTRITPEALTGPQTILYNTDSSGDRVFALEFLR